MSGPLLDDRDGDCHHLDIEIALGAGELRRPNLARGAQCEQRHPRAAWLDDDHPLTPAQGEAPNADNTCLRHRRADPPERLDPDRAIGKDVIRRAEINGIEFAARDKLLQVDDLRAFDIGRLQLLRVQRDELAALER